MREGLAREVVRKVQQARKNARFQLDDRIRLEISCSGDWKQAVETHREMICGDTLSKEFALTEVPQGTHVETVDIDGESLSLGLTVLGKR